MIEENKLIEWAEYVGNYYGTPKEYVEQQLKAGKDVLLEIEMQGGMLVKKQFPDAMLVFVTPPSAEILKDRLTVVALRVRKRLSAGYTVLLRKQIL